jgi:hypothetical protein
MITSNFFRSSLEKDFEYFVRNIGKLNPAEFCGLAKVLSVPMIDKEKVENLTQEQIEELKLQDKENYMIEFARPMDKVLEEMMDRFLGLSKKRRREINQILKDIQRGK